MIPQINLFWVKKNKYQIAVVLLLFIVLFQCNNKDNSKPINTHQTNADKFQQEARDATEISNNIIKDYQEKLRKKDADIDKLRRDSQLNNKLINTKLKSIMSYGNSDIAKYYIDRYNQPQAIKSVSVDEVTIKDTLSRFIISDLIKYDGVNYNYDMLTKEYSIVNNKFNLANTTIDTLKISINNISNAYEKSNDENKLAIKEAEKQLRKEKRNKTLYKITTVAAIIGGGYLLVK
jgi:hypothetical protein